MITIQASPDCSELCEPNHPFPPWCFASVGCLALTLNHPHPHLLWPWTWMGWSLARNQTLLSWRQVSYKIDKRKANHTQARSAGCLEICQCVYTTMVKSRNKGLVIAASTLDQHDLGAPQSKCCWAGNHIAHWTHSWEQRPGVMLIELQSLDNSRSWQSDDPHGCSPCHHSFPSTMIGFEAWWLIQLHWCGQWRGASCPWESLTQLAMSGHGTPAQVKGFSITKFLEISSSIS